MIKKMLTLLAAVLFVIPFAVAADDFDDDFGGFDEESEESEEDEEEAPAKKVKEESESDAAMRDLMGEPAEEKPVTKTKEKSDSQKDSENQPENEEKASKGIAGLKPVLLVKGGFTVMGQYKEYNPATQKTTSPNSMFGSVDEGIVGIEYNGKHVLAKGTLNLRTNNALIEHAVNNPLIKENYHSIQDGAANALYEVYGGVKFFDVFIKGGKMLPEYGLIDTYQELGMGFSTPFLSRSLIVVEGFIPETDAGIALGYNGVIKNVHNVFAGLSLGTGSNKSEFWYSDKTLGIYGRVGYGFKEYIKASFAFMHRKDYYSVEGVSKKLDVTGIGVHLKGAVAGFEMPVSFDYVMNQMVKGTAKKNTTGLLLSLAPGYAYHFKHDWIDKVAVALRFDFVQGVYLNKEGNYLDLNNYKKDSSYMRIGVTANFFTKELGGVVRGMAGLTFLMQPESTVDKKDSNGDNRKKDYGFTTIVLQAGAEI